MLFLSYASCRILLWTYSLEYGTKKIMTIGIVIISLSNIILVSAPESYILLLAHIPAGIG